MKRGVSVFLCTQKTKHYAQDRNTSTEKPKYPLKIPVVGFKLERISDRAGKL